MDIKEKKCLGYLRESEDEQMLLKRIYEHDEDDRLVMDSEGNAVLDHIKILRAGQDQHFSEGLVGGGILEGWIALKDDELALLTKPRAVYRIKRNPGYYCCHCGEAMPGSQEAKAHIADEHLDTKSPAPVTLSNILLNRPSTFSIRL